MIEIWAIYVFIDLSVTRRELFMKKTETATRALVKAKKKRNLAPYLLLLPPVLLVLIFMVYPIGYVFRLSFYDYNPVMPWLNGFKGFGNFVSIITGSEFWQAMLVSLKWVFWEVILQFTLGLIIALLLNQKFKARGFFRALIFIPWAMSGVLTAVLWNLIYNQNIGILNDLLMKVGLIETGKAWISNPSTALPSLILAELWRGVPFFAISLLAAMQNIPTELYEAGKIDGANRWQSLIHITVPQLKETIVLTTLLRTVNEFNSVDLIYSLTGGGPVGRTTTVSILLANQATKSTNYGYGSAMSVICFIILAIFAVIYLKITRFGKEEN